MNDLSLTLIQVPTIWENPNQNQDQVYKVLDHPEFQKTDIIVLPEMWTTGFSMRPEILAEKMSGLSVQWMIQVAKEKDCAVIGSLIIEENSNYFNRLIFAKSDGTIEFYDKRHCFGLALEDKYFTSGNSRKTIEWRSWKICPLICYDLRFPVWSRNTENYDLLLYVAQFPEKRRNAWISLLSARAIENVSYVAGVNGLGVDGNGIQYSGDSGVWDYEGVCIAQLGNNANYVQLTLHKPKLEAFRRAYPFLKDQDHFSIL